MLLDEASLLACAAYVDLNPVRAAIAETPEESEFTGAKDRIDDLKERADSSSGQPRSTREWERSRRRSRSGWMSPLEICDSTGGPGADASPCGRRASLKGFLSVSLTKYLELLDWTGREIRHGKRGVIPPRLSPILERLGLDTSGWCDLVKKFGRLFKRAAGNAEHLSEEASRRGQSYLQAPGAHLLSAASV